MATSRAAGGTAVTSVPPIRTDPAATASSPALIEKTRSVVTDEQGRYQIIELRPGTYAVTFTLPGFAVFRRDGVELVTGFTANVKITNSGTSAISAWQLVWDFPAGQTLAQAWSSTITVADGKATAKGANYNADVPAGGSVNFGFNANTTGAVPEPASFTLNGSACSTG